MKTLPRVLLADDTPDQLSAHAHILGLEPQFVRLQTATNGREALDAYLAAKEEGEPFKLLIMDLAMPLMNGFQVAEAIRENGDDATKIVFLTNYDKDFENDLRARSCGAVSMWTKDQPTKLRDQVKKVLDTESTEYVPHHLDAEEQAADQQGAVKIMADISRKEKRKFHLVAWVIAAALVGNICLTLFNMARAPRVYTAISSINKKLDGAVATNALPAGMRTIVPSTKSAFKRMAPAKDGSYGTRVTFEFEPKYAAQAESIAAERGVPLWLQVTREK
jgi:CheY-like chemotaxis protein